VEKTFVLVKPDGVQRGLVGEVISRLERRGLRLVAAKFMRVSRELAEEHYAIHKGKPFYDGLIAYIT
jgi:nucleoside-diphosphate kinase